MISLLKNLIVLFLFLFMEFSFSIDNQKNPHRFVITNGYWEEEFNSNEGMSYFPQSIYDMYDWTFRKISIDANSVTRILSAFLADYITDYVVNVVNVSYHEFGHATRYRYYKSEGIYYIPVNNVSEGNVSRRNFFQMVWDRVLYPNSGAATAAFTPQLTLSQETMLAAAGMNNEILLAKNLAERVFERGGSAPDFGLYLNSKLSPYNYTGISSSSGDPAILRDNFLADNKNITLTDMQNAYLWTALLSGTSISLFYGNIMYVAKNQHNINPLYFGMFSLPDFYTYIGSKGISLETIMHLFLSPKILASLSYEIVTKGDFYNQVTPQLRIDTGKNTFVKSNFVFGFGDGIDIGGSISVEFENKYLGSLLKYTYYNSDNLYGLRNIPFQSSPHEITFGAYTLLK